MARLISAGRLAALVDKRRRSFARVLVEDPDSVYRDVSNLFGLDFLEGGSVLDNIDNPVPSGTITLHREHRGSDGVLYSLAPTLSASPINRNAANEYARFLKAGRGIRVFVGWDVPGGADDFPADYLEVLQGKIDEVDWKGRDGKASLSVRGLGAWLLDKVIEVEREYADDVGVPIEDVMQQILDDNEEPRLGPVVLYVPTSPGVAIRRYTQERKSVLEALRDLAFQIGWLVRYTWLADGSYRLTLFEPDRAKVVPDWTLGPGNYFDVAQLKETDADVRNKIKGIATDAEGEPLEYVASDADSIGEHGTRYMEFTEDSTSEIDTMGELSAMVDAALADLKAPPADQEIENDLFPVAEVGDLGRWLANGRHYDAAQDMAVVQVRHEFSTTSRRTFIQSRGSVIGGSKEWLRRGNSKIGPLTGDEEFDPSTIYLGNFREIERTATQIRYGFKPSASVAQIWVYRATQSIGAAEPWPPTEAEVAAGAAPAAPVVKLSGDTTEFVVQIPPNGQVTYVQLEPRNENYVAGDVHRVRVFAVQEPPKIETIAQEAGPSSLYTAVEFDIVDAQGQGGTVRAWTNPTSAENASPSGTPDGTVTVVSTPAHIDADTVFDTPGGPGTLLAAVKVHPGRGKRVFFEFVNEQGTSSGVVSVTLLTNGGIIDENGDLLPGSIKDALQFASTIQPVQVLTALPSSAPDGTVVLLTTDGQLYRRVGGAWTLAVPAVNITGTIVASQIADAAVNTAKFAAGIRPVRVLGALPGAGDVVGDVVFLTTDNKLYRWTGAAWTSTMPTTDLTGTILEAQIADAAVNTAKFAAGIRPVRVLGALPGAGDVVGDVVFLTTDNKLYRWTGAAWTAAVPAADVSGTLVAAQIADAAITTAKFAAGIRPVRIVAALPGAGDVQGDTVFLTTDNKLYRWTGAAWIATVPTADLTGTIVTGQIADAALTTAKFAAGIRPVRILGALPGAGDVEGDTVYLTTDDKLYRWTGAAWIATVPTTDLTGTIDTAQIAANAVTATQLAANAVTTAKIAAGAVDTAAIAAGAVDTAKLANNAVTSAIIAANAVTSTQIAANAVTTPKILAGAVVTASIAAGAVTANEIAALTITAGQIAAGAVTTAKINAGAVTANEIAALTIVAGNIAAGTITGAKIAANTITAGNIQALTITAAEIAATTITGAKLVAGTITTTQIATDTITAGNIAAGAVSTSELAALAVTAAKIAAGTITANEIASLTILAGNIAAGQITTAKIAAGAVTATEIAADTITAGQIAAGAVSTSELAALAVTAAKIAAGTITANEIAALTITAAQIAAATITGAKIAANTITAGNIAADTITAGEIAAGAISTSELAAGAVTAAKIFAGTITSNEIASATITGGNIAAGTITAGNIAADTITAGQIAAGAISTSELAAGAVTAAKIAAGTITANEIAGNTITAGQIATGTITATQIAGGTITAAELASNSIIAGKIAAGAINAAAIIVDGVITAAKLSISVLSSISDDVGIVVAGRLESANGQSYIDLDATGASPFIHHATGAGVTTFEVLANGNATFSGDVASTNFTAFAADFSAQVKVGRTRPSGTAEVHSLWLYGDTSGIAYGIVTALDTVPYGHPSDLSGNSGFTSNLRGGDFSTGYVYNFGVMMAKVIAAVAAGPSGSAPEGTIWCEI